MPRLLIVTTGGTIASRTDPVTGAAVAAASGSELVAAVPQLADLADVDVVEVARVNSWDLVPATMAEVARVVVERVVNVDGVVVTHGTDTLEETAVALDVLVEHRCPVVLTGAMRAADDPAPDGPRNLLAAARVALDPRVAPLGPVVVLDGEVHGAREVTKTHTTALGTFASPGTGPLGRVDADGVVVAGRHVDHPIVAPVPDPAGVRVPIVYAAAGVDDAALRAAVREHVDGVVLAGTGAGNVPGAWLPAIRDLVDAGVPVVLASRTGSGRVVAAYGGDGGGATLARVGVRPAGTLNAQKARCVLLFALAAGLDPDGAQALLTP